MRLSIFCATLTFFVGMGVAHGQDFASSCTLEISNQPYCIKIANSQSFCQRADSQILKMAIDCLSKMVGQVGPDGASFLCLGVDIQTQEPELSKSNCGP